MPSQQNFMVPVSIGVAVLVIAGALFIAGGSTEGPGHANGTNGANNVPAVTSEDHILGNPDASVVIVEYTDLECPFCKVFHKTMEQVMAEYGESGEVAWVLRNFPLEQLHPNAPRLAEAAECVAELRGNEAYWSFIDAMFTLAPANTLFDMSKLTQTASGVGISSAAFDACLEDGRHKDKVAAQYNDAVALGGQGTPHSIAIVKDGQNVVIEGAQQYETVKGIIDAALR